MRKKGYLGYVAPIILVLRRTLIKLTNLKYCRQLCIKIVQSLEKRFDYLFDLSLPKSKSFVIASISHPKFKLSWIPVRYIDQCKQLFLTECNEMYTNISDIQKKNSVASDDENSENSDQEYYTHVCMNTPIMDSLLLIQELQIFLVYRL